MSAQKIFKIIAYISIGLSILVIIGLTLLQQWQINKLKQGIDSEVSSEIGTSSNTADRAIEANQQITDQTANGPSPDTSETDDLDARLNETENKLDSAYKQLSEQTDKNAENAKNEREFYKKMTQNPSFKAGIRESMKNTNETLYGPLFKALDLSPEKLEKLKDLLADYQADIIVISQGILSVSTQEEGTELQKRYDNTLDAYKTKFNELLGNADYKKYQAYQDRLNERYVVSMFMETLSSDEKLTENQQQGLIESLYKEREDVYSELDYDPKKLEAFIFMNDDSIARRMKATEEIHSRALENAEGFLSASQYEQLKNYLKQQREIEEESLKLAVQQFGGTITQE